MICLRARSGLSYLFTVLSLTLVAQARAANTGNQEWLVQMAPMHRISAQAMLPTGAQMEALGSASTWVKVKVPSQIQTAAEAKRWLQSLPGALDVQPNYKLGLYTDYRERDPKKLAQLLAQLPTSALSARSVAKPDIPDSPPASNGADPLTDKQWGMKDIGTQAAWAHGQGDGVVVAVIDTGVDYTHEDLIENLWRNPGETGVDNAGKDKSKNGIDDDKNGFIDDVIGWDFTAANDNKPFDIAVEPAQLLFGGGNPGHGTHCAGNVAARSENGKGIAGAAPKAKIMALRFLTEKGEGSTADAIKAINYAVANGAKILSNSWGAEGEDPNEAVQNKALQEAITNARNKGVLFIAAAGNGHQGVGYDNDTDAKPAYPASYNIDNIISVAALDSQDNLGKFSNWGAKTVHIGAPGVAIFSTTVGSKYSEKVLELGGTTVTWDGTSMAAPHVSGVAALYWSAHPAASYMEVKTALLRSAKSVPSLQGKTVSGGKLNAQALMADY